MNNEHVHPVFTGILDGATKRPRGSGMTHDQKLITIRAMKRFGGSFVKQLASLWLLADEENARKIEGAFPAYVKSYGPGSAKFDAQEQEDA